MNAQKKFTATIKWQALKRISGQFLYSINDLTPVNAGVLFCLNTVTRYKKRPHSCLCGSVWLVLHYPLSDHSSNGSKWSCNGLEREDNVI